MASGLFPLLYFGDWTRSGVPLDMHSLALAESVTCVSMGDEGRGNRSGDSKRGERYALALATGNTCDLASQRGHTSIQKQPS